VAAEPVLPDITDPSLRAQIADLYEDYAACLDDGELVRWPEFFTEDCTYKVISKENFDQDLPHGTMYCDGIAMIRDRVMALRETQVFEPRTLRRLVGRPRIGSVDELGVHSKANVAVFESMSDREPTLYLVGAYHDLVVHDGERWRFRERLCVFDNYRIRQSLVIPI
jgi:anthranilate 1,2-dioxygenase small subunit